MARFFKDRAKATGQAPGSLVFIGKQKMDSPIIKLMQYTSDSLVEKELNSIDEADGFLSSDGVSWINIYGIHDLELIKRIGEKFKINHLILEDMLNTDQRPKYDDGDTYDAFILKMLSYDNEKKQIHAEQITIVLGENYVLTLQERKGDVFEPVRNRIRQSKGRVRLKNSDYLAYILMDTIADNYLILIEKIGRKVEELEDRIFGKKDDKIVEEIYNYKTEINYLRKNIRPVKDLMAQLIKSENSFFLEQNQQYLRDLNDLIVHSSDAIELYNSLVSDQLNIYNTNVSNRMNEVMKVLTIFASIFIPLTFIAGIYGMNFEHIPELQYKYSYLFFWIATLVIISGLLYYFRKKRWL